MPLFCGLIGPSLKPILVSVWAFRDYYWALCMPLFCELIGPSLKPILMSVWAFCDFTIGLSAHFKENLNLINYYVSP